MSSDRIVPHSWINEAVELAQYARGTEDLVTQCEVGSEIHKIVDGIYSVLSGDPGQRSMFVLLADALRELAWSLDIVTTDEDRFDAISRVLFYDSVSPMTMYRLDPHPFLFSWNDVPSYPALPVEIDEQRFRRRFADMTTPRGWGFLGGGNSWLLTFDRHHRAVLRSHFPVTHDSDELLDFLDWLKKELEAAP